MKKVLLYFIVTCLWAMPGQGAAAQAQPSTPAVRPIGVVTEIQAGSFKLHTDAGPDLTVQLPDGISVVRVPPGSKDLKSASKISVSDIAAGDRVLVRGKTSEDQKSVTATSVIVMSKTELASARQAEQLDWQKRGIGGLVKAVDAGKKQITISVPNTPPTPGNPTHPVAITLAPNASVLRYAPDSVKFSDAKPSTMDEIKTGDQVRALGTKSEDGTQFSAEKLVSGTFRNLGATVISVDAAAGSVTVKDLATSEPVVVKTNPDSKLHRLPQFMAQMIAMFNSGQIPNGGGPGSGTPAGGAAGGASGRPAGGNWAAGAQGSGSGARPSGGMGGHGGAGGGPRDFNQMLDRAPVLKLDELKAGDALIVVSTEGKDPSQVTAIVMLAGVEPILAARPKGSTEVVLGPWNMSMGGGDTQ